MARILQIAGFFLGSAVAAAFVMSEIPPTFTGYAARSVVLWLAMYPFVVYIRFPLRSYWIVLVVGLPVSMAARYSGPARPVLAVLTVVLLIGSMLVPLIRRLREAKQVRTQ